MFKLDSRLQNDTHFVCDLTLCRVLLMNDSQFPWLILVPMQNDVAEIIDLSEAQQHTLLKESAVVQNVMKNRFAPFKLNVAAIGNVVRQLHVHHVARFENDVAWPKPVWGNQPTVAYSDDEARKLVKALRRDIEDTQN